MSVTREKRDKQNREGNETKGEERRKREKGNLNKNFFLTSINIKHS